MASRTCGWPGGATARRDRDLHPARHAPHRSTRSLAARAAARAPPSAAARPSRWWRSSRRPERPWRGVGRGTTVSDALHDACRRYRRPANGAWPASSRPRARATPRSRRRLDEPQSAFASRICSTVRQFASSSRGRATRYARHCAREIATLSRFREKRKSSPRGTSSAARARHRVEDDRRLLALELVHGADRDRRRQLARAGSGRARCTARPRSRPRAASAPRAVARRRTASRRSRSISAATASASSGDCVRLPSCSTGRKRIPLPARERPLERRVGRLEPPLVERLRDERVHLRAASATSARGRGPSPAAPSRRRRAGAGAPTRPRPAGASPARPARAGSGRRAARRSAPPCRRRSRPRARPGPPSSTNSVSTCPSISSRENRNDVPASSCSSSSSIAAFVRAVDELVLVPRLRVAARLLPAPERVSLPRAPRRATSSRNLWIALWLSDVTPTRCPRRISSIAIRAPRHVLPEPGGPWTNR